MLKSAWNAWECQRKSSLKSLMLAGAAIIMVAAAHPAVADDTPPKPSSPSVQDAPSPMEAARRAAEQRNAQLEKLKQEREQREARQRPPQPPAPPAPPAPPPAKTAWDKFCEFLERCFGTDDATIEREAREALERAIEQRRREREQQAGGDKPATGSAEAAPKPQQDAPARQAETPKAETQKAVPQKSAHTQPRSISNKPVRNPKSAMRTAASGVGAKAARHAGQRNAQRAMANARNIRALRHSTGRYAPARRMQPSRIAHRSPVARGLAQRSFAPAHHGMRANMRVMQPRMAMGTRMMGPRMGSRMGSAMMGPRMTMGPRMAGPAFGRSMGGFGGRGMSFGGRSMGGFGRF